MLDIYILIGLIGFAIAGWQDLKTSEFSGKIPIAMILVSLFLHFAFVDTMADFLPVLINGAMFSGIGILMYSWFKWGDGDAWLLAALGFLYPFNVTFIIVRFFIASFLYIGLWFLACRLRRYPYPSKTYPIRFAPAFLLTVLLLLV